MFNIFRNLSDLPKHLERNKILKPKAFYINKYYKDLNIIESCIDFNTLIILYENHKIIAMDIKNTNLNNNNISKNSNNFFNNSEFNHIEKILEINLFSDNTKIQKSISINKLRNSLFIVYLQNELNNLELKCCEIKLSEIRKNLALKNKIYENFPLKNLKKI